MFFHLHQWLSKRHLELPLKPVLHIGYIGFRKKGEKIQVFFLNKSLMSFANSIVIVIHEQHGVSGDTEEVELIANQLKHETLHNDTSFLYRIH